MAAKEEELKTEGTTYNKEDGSVENSPSADEFKTQTYPFANRRGQSSLRSRSVIKHGHLRVKEDGQKVFKKTPSQAIMSATQLGIGYSVGRLSATKERDILMNDFFFVEKVWFPSAGTKETPPHKHNDFRFKAYAPVAFRYFRDLFGIQPSDFLLSLANEPIREISNPGASGSLFFLSNDDMFIVKTVTNKEATFLQQLLPGYYMNIHQNQRTLLPKFFGLYCYQSGTSNIRLTVMNNLLPSRYKCQFKFDLKGSTYKRKASKEERAKKSPTLKDLDFVQQFPNGINLDAETYDNVIKTISRDVRVLESFYIMDYSFLLSIHNIDETIREKEANLINSPTRDGKVHNPGREARKNEFSAALEAIPRNETNEDSRPLGGIPARNDKGERLILFIGIIDILQNYGYAKKMEHAWKSLLTDGDTVSVHKPSYYSTRFLNFIKDVVFTRFAMQRTNSKRRPMRVSQFGIRGESMSSRPEVSATIEPHSGSVKSNKVVTIVEPENIGSDNLNESLNSEKIAVESEDISLQIDYDQTTKDTNS